MTPRLQLLAWLLLVVPLGLDVPLAAQDTPCPDSAAEDLFGAATELAEADLIEQVLARNPSLAEMISAWQAALARYPQARSLEDPMAAGVIGPASIGSPEVDFAYRVEIAQKVPFPGKLALRGQGARAQAQAAESEVEQVRLQLIESARLAFYEFYLTDRSLAVNEESLRLLAELRQNAEARFKAGLVPQQDIRQADVAIGREQQRRLTLQRRRKVVIARINTLLHLPPDRGLPPPPQTLVVGDNLPEAALLRALAADRRPEIHALLSRLQADEAALALARKEVCPDFEFMAAYDAFWQPPERDLRPMLGVRLNLPVYRSRRLAAIAEAQARIAQRHAELARLADQVHFEVQQAYDEVVESVQTARLYEESILPAARDNVRLALAAYLTARVPFVSLVEAQRDEVALKEGYYETVADYFRRLAALERAVGGPFLQADCVAAPRPGPPLEPLSEPRP